MPNKIKNSMKDLINIKNNGNKYFLWCHIRHLNPLKIHPERITIADISMVKDLSYEDIEFPVSKNSTWDRLILGVMSGEKANYVFLSPIVST